MENTEKENLTPVSENPNGKNKKSLKWLWATVALILVGVLTYWCVTAAGWGKENSEKQGVDLIVSLSALLFGMFVVTALGYMFGRITIKGVSLGTAGVFIVAILFGVACSFIPSNLPVLGSLHLDSSSKALGYYSEAIQNIGLVLFIGAVGFIAGPKFFRDLAKNFKTYILMGILIILVGTAVAVGFALIMGEGGADFSAGVLSGALTSTPGYSAALEATKNSGLVTLGYAIAYPFGVIGVVLFVQLVPKVLKSDMQRERSLLKVDLDQKGQTKNDKKLLRCDEFGLTSIALAIISGLIVGSIKIPLTAKGYNGACFSLGKTGGVLIMCLVFGHLGRIGKLSLEVPAHSAKVLRELGLMLFLIGAGVSGGVELVAQIQRNSAIATWILWGLLGGMVMTVTPMIMGFIVGGKMLKLPLLNNLGSITGGMTSTPALGTLINTAETEDVAGSYASTYPIALILIVLACNLMIGLL